MLVISITPTHGTVMEQSQFDALQRWFDSYVATYGDIEEPGYRNILLKIEHTGRVCRIMKSLADGEGLSPERQRTAAAVALLHDVGRFPQYRRWQTFRDSDSDNHARLSIEVIREQELLTPLPPEERLLIEEAVRLHNQLTLPRRFRSPTDRYIRLIRDADKLDIWSIFRDYFSTGSGDRPSAATLGFPDLPVVTPACVAELAAGRIIDLKLARVVNDFKLLQISWVYDLNFPSSYRLLQQLGHIEALAETIPGDGQVSAAVALALQTIDRKARKEFT